MAISSPPALSLFKNCTRCKRDCCISGGDGAFDAASVDDEYGGFVGENLAYVDSRENIDGEGKRKPDCRRFEVAFEKTVGTKGFRT